MTANTSEQHVSQAMVPPPYYYAPPMDKGDDEIDLRELWRVIWQGKWIILACTLVLAAGAVFYAIKQPNIYKAQALLAPADNESGGLSAMARQYGGLASLAGINLGGGGSDKTALAIEVLQSRKFITDFIERHNLLVPLMAVKGWNRDTDELILDGELYDSTSDLWVRQVDPPQTPKPTPWEAHKAFNKLMAVSEAKDTGMVTVAVEHLSPTVAKQWVDWLVEDVNAVMKAKDVREAQNSIEFLGKQLQRTSVTEMQNVFYQLIEEQTKTIMLSEVRDEYVFTTVDPAVVPEEKAKPKRALIAVLGTILGGMLGVMIVLIRHFSKQTPSDEQQTAP